MRMPFRQTIGSPVATTTSAGLMSAADKLKVDNLYRGSGSPEGAVAASYGLYIDETNKKLYGKVSGTGNTGWREISPSRRAANTPAATAVSNLDAVTAAQFSWVSTKTGSSEEVFFAGRVNVDPTAAGNVVFRITPFWASNFVTSQNAMATVTGLDCTRGQALADSTNDAIEVTATMAGPGASNIFITGSYQVLP